MTIRRNKKREIKQLLIDLMVLTEKPKDFDLEITEALINNVLNNKLQLILRNNKCLFQNNQSGLGIKNE